MITAASDQAEIERFFAPLPEVIDIEVTHPDGTRRNERAFTATLMAPRIEATDTGSEAEEYWVTTFSIEYCRRDCDGTAHTTGVSDAREGCFCGKHVHRSAHVMAHKVPGMTPMLQGL